MIKIVCIILIEFDLFIYDLRFQSGLDQNALKELLAQLYYNLKELS